MRTLTDLTYIGKNNRGGLSLGINTITSVELKRRHLGRGSALHRVMRK
jgi:hypothetical protein